MIRRTTLLAVLIAYIAPDTYRDGRNAYLIEMNALGTQDDATITDENITIDSFSWDAVFKSETVIDEEGWSMEVSIPFRQLRFPDGEELEFGLMISRMINRKNERVMWPRIGLEYGSWGAIAAVSQYSTLSGISNIRRGKNVAIKPYVITGAQEARADLGTEATEVAFTRDISINLKYGVTSNLTSISTHRSRSNHEHVYATRCATRPLSWHPPGCV